MMTVNGKIPLLVICGPTASGKTGLAVDIAKRWPIEVISADSRQIYQQMDIGTAKATAAEQQAVRHHLIDIIAPDQTFSVAQFVHQAQQKIAEIMSRQHIPVVVGGTGLYIRGLIRGLADVPKGDEQVRQQLLAEEHAQGAGTLYRRLQQVDPVQADRIHPNNLVRVTRALEVYTISGRPFSEYQDAHAFAESPYRSRVIGLNPGREVVYERINQRAQWMVENGLVEETQRLLEQFSSSSVALQTLGYREIQYYLMGEWDLKKTVEQIQQQTRRYAKRQMTWFNREPDVNWLASSVMSGNINELIGDFMKIKGECYGEDPV